jgi:3-oxoacyl-[acyl-carrier-protein] synthase II
VRARLRIAVTGVGVVTALGRNQNEYWSAVLEGRCGIGPLDLFDPGGCLSSIAGQASAPDAGDPMPRGNPGPGPNASRVRAARRLSRSDRFCLMAAEEAVAQAGLRVGGALSRYGVALGCSTAGMLEAEQVHGEARTGGWGRARLSPLLRLPTSAPADAIARRIGLGGPRLSNMTACASATLAIGLAADRIRTGEADGMLAGGGDALCRLTFSGFNSLRLLSPEPCRPFDRDRSGMSLGEGAGVLVLEPWERAVERGARVLAELLDYGASCDAHHMTAAHPAGRGALTAMREALARSGVAASEVDYVNAHGTGTPSNDAAEARALLELFGDRIGRVSVSSTKSLVGHLLGGAGGVEAATVVLALLHQTAPPTLGVRAPEAEGRIDFVPDRARPARLRVAISNSFGFGGANACVAFRAAETA